MYRKLKYFIGLLFLGAFLFSCVPARQFQDLKDKNQKCEEERDLLKAENQSLAVKVKELESENAMIKKQLVGLLNDTTVMGVSLRTIKLQYNDIDELNKKLLEKQKELLKGNQAEQRKLLEELEALRLNLQKQEDDLRKLEKDLMEKQKSITDAENELEAKNKRLAELERKLTYNDSIVRSLKDKVSKALTGFEGQGLTVEQKNGKVYVSLDEKLLFKSGKWDVDPKGQKALENLADVLAKNEDINIMIEGHTDDVPYGGTGNVTDNWDLSAKRATAIVKILLKNTQIDARRLTAAGRGEFVPVDPSKTTEARAKNRRTEIILTPKLDELFNILNSN
ncbi:MAG: hypothetical protein A2W91_01010 [Bacteroidetes bacterium GWF2_38_335]|nr:MAG: hypothetical protein A2W91_01010 [Bacteroidetes bacterium GWF2_38_335]OFY80333.1 MAG: hypothetical protein A2281_17520 [Bacteroidetes bacterium RIFOXYA12_FULL_38_20]HBS88866.1 hypothetical protein [Bacteroidales bacterium]